ncbi:MAG: 3-deoxy-8-phosphooctulonate synthase [bacterium]|nr:3-deoxy-8-phosphooctulonate synthase [bacterium]
MKTRIVEAGGVRIGGGLPLVLIAGPCVIESEAMLLETGRGLVEVSRSLGVPLVFKTSFDKANRSAHDAYRGPGLEEGLAVLRRAKAALGVPFCVDVHEPGQVEAVAAVAEIVQVPAFLCRQTDLIRAACRSGRVVNVKKGQFLAPDDAANIIGKVEAFDGRGLLITERGCSFGYHNLVSDMRALPVMRGLGWPVVFDATHSVQIPGGLGTRTGGRREFVPVLARAAAAAGCDALFLEAHPRPDEALSDATSQVPIDGLAAILGPCLEIDRIVKRLENRACGAASGG